MKSILMIRKQRFREVTYQYHKLDSDWARTQSQCHKTLKPRIFVTVNFVFG